MSRQWPLLVRQRLITWRRDLVRATWSRIFITAVCATLATLCFPAAVAAFFWFFSGLLASNPDHRQLVELALEIVLAAAFLIGMVFSFTSAAREFGQSAPNLAAAWPFDPADAFAARMIAVVSRGCWPSLMVVFPAMLAIQWLSAAPPVYFLWVIALTALHAIAAIGTGVLFYFLLIHAEWRISPAISRLIAIGVLLVSVAYVARVAVDEVVGLLGGQGRPGLFFAPFDGLAATAAAGVTGHEADPRVPIFALAAIAVVSWLLVAVFGRLDEQRWLQVAESSPKPVRRSGSRLWSRFMAPRHVFLHEKERLSFFRDVDGLGRFFMIGALTAALLGTVWTMRGAAIRGGILGAADAAAVVVAAIGFLTLIAGLRFCFPALSLEGREAWVLRSSPMHIHELFSWKFFFWAGLFAVLATPSTALAGVWLGLPTITVILMAAITLVVAVTLVALTLGQGFMFPEFAGPGMRPLPAKTPEYFAASPAGLMSVVLGCLYLFIIARYVRRFVGWYLVTGAVDGQSILGAGVVSVTMIAAYWLLAPHALERSEAGL